MSGDFSKTSVLFAVILFVLIMVYFWFFTTLLSQVAWLAIPLFVYLLFFITRDQKLKKKFSEESRRIKPRTEIRINFWN